VNLGDVQISLEADVVIARLTGEIDLSNADGIEQAIVVATPNQAKVILLDLTEVDYIDSAGIHLIYRLRQKLQSRGQAFTLILDAESPAGDALRLAGVIDHLEIRDSVDAALE
jgi:anti-anti-sigma factor